MTLIETINLLNWIAQNQPNVNGIVETGDVYDLNKDEYQQKYAAFCATQGEHEITESWSRFSFILYYVDRLNLDKSNKDEIHSTAVEFFHNFASTIYSNYPTVDFTAGRVVTFTERFSAECAGAYMTCEIVTTPQSLCPIEFGETPGPEPVTITTYEFEGELEYYSGNWMSMTQGGVYSGSFNGQSTSTMSESYKFNEIHFPLRITDISGYTGTDRLIQYLVVIRKPIEGEGNSNAFLPCFGFPNFKVYSSNNKNNELCEVVTSGYIDSEAKIYDDYVIKCDNTFTVNPGNEVFLLIHSLGCYVWMKGWENNQQKPLYENDGKSSRTILCGTKITEVFRYSPFNISWYRFAQSAGSSPSRCVVCQPILKLTI